MSMWKNLIAVSALLIVLNGCAVIFDPVPYVEVEYEMDVYRINSYVHIPAEVREIIAGYVVGYSMPEVDMYGPEIYPDVGPRDYKNLPSYIEADFNGDRYTDYAYMFSRVSWSGNNWYLKTKLLVVTSNWEGYSLCAEYDLGTVSGGSNVPIEEYWGIRLLRRGTHSITTHTSHGRTEKVTFTLENDGIYLGSIDPEERTVFYVDRNTLREFPLDMGAIAKKKVLSAEERADRIIKL
jgi:hypothetical protein